MVVLSQGCCHRLTSHLKNGGAACSQVQSQEGVQQLWVMRREHGQLGVWRAGITKVRKMWEASLSSPIHAHQWSSLESKRNQATCDMPTKITDSQTSFDFSNHLGRKSIF